MPCVLGELSWPELRDRMGKVSLAIIPTGSTEQHGPNMCFLSDTMIAIELAHRLCKRLYPQAVVVPAVPWGVSQHHMSFCGTLTLSPDTLEKILLDISRSLSTHGIKKVLVLNCHGGNQSAINTAGHKAKANYGIEVANVMHFSLIRPETLQRITSTRWGHACEAEVSLAMYLCPEAVKTSSLAAGELRSYPYYMADPASRDSRISVPYMFEELTENGALGDARLSSREFGEKLAEDIIDGCTRFAQSFISGESN